MASTAALTPTVHLDVRSWVDEECRDQPGHAHAEEDVEHVAAEGVTDGHVAVPCGRADTARSVQWTGVGWRLSVGESDPITHT